MTTELKGDAGLITGPVSGAGKMDCGMGLWEEVARAAEVGGVAIKGHAGGFKEFGRLL